MDSQGDPLAHLTAPRSLFRAENAKGIFSLRLRASPGGGCLCVADRVHRAP